MLSIDKKIIFKTFKNFLANKSSVSCLGRCDLPKHRCMQKGEVKPGPIPKHMGWLYTAKDAPEHQVLVLINLS